MYSQRYRPHQKRQRNWKAWAIIAVILIIMIAVVLRWVTSDQQGTVTSKNGNTAQNKAPTSQTYKSKYINLVFSGEYKEKSRVDNQPGLEQVLFRSPNGFDKTFAIEYQPLPQGGIIADTGFGFRQLHPNDYQRQQLTVAGESAVLWVKNDGGERTIYIPHKSSYAVLSLSVSQTNDTSGLADEFSAILQLLGWKQ